MSNESAAFIFVVCVACALIFAVYAAPSIVAFVKNHPNRWLILVLNVIFGVTLFGWFLLMLWSLRSFHRTKQVGGSHGGESGLNLFANDVRRVDVAVRSMALPYSADAPSDSLLNKISKLERLMALHKEGMLSEAEFLRMKNSIL
ncbi:superinfection immunity protein [Methylobacterium sp. OAE515]|uniref:superinfection immunity protein n=1 Tax=Methylobacterium sp. OAE515 TaxID=2817895 RepID=UPI00178BE58A